MQNDQYPLMEIPIALVLSLVTYFLQSPFPANVEHNKVVADQKHQENRAKTEWLYMMLFYFPLVNPGLISVI
jgi:di/tricarboxylate transporter